MSKNLDNINKIGELLKMDITLEGIAIAISIGGLAAILWGTIEILIIIINNKKNKH